MVIHQIILATIVRAVCAELSVNMTVEGKNEENEHVLEGSIVMGVKGGEPVTLTPGQTFYEGPDDIHTVSRNASKTKPAKFLVFLLKDKDAPVLVPVK
jgi:quercetin dioxygenase-like cupin family protein